MAQTDMTVSNDTGSNVRTDVQNHLQALASTSLGTAAPSTIYQGQQWIDSNTPSGTIWTWSVYDGAQSIGLFYVDTANNIAEPVSALPLRGFTAGSSYYMSGDILMGQNSTTTPGSGNTTLGGSIGSNGSVNFSNNGSYVGLFNRNSNGTSIAFALSGTAVGSISVSGSSTAYNTSSDHRLKTNVEPIDWRDAAAKIARMNPVWFNWIAQPLGDRVDGFIAHELAEVLPGAVTGEKDATQIVGGVERIVPQGVDQAKLTPLLTAALKGLLAEVDRQAAQIAALVERVAALEAPGQALLERSA